MSGDRVTDENAALRKALQALEHAAGGEPAGTHPGMEVLEAYVEGRLGPAERTEVDRLAARSPMVAEDLADLKRVREGLTAAPVARRDVRWMRVAAGIAAGIVMIVWLSDRSTPLPGEQGSRVVPEERARVDAAVAEGRVTLPANVVALIRREGTLLNSGGRAATFTPIAPVATAVHSAWPSFSWSDAGAEAYTVAVFDQTFTEVARSPRLTVRSWTPDVELPAGTYVWQVTAHRATGDDTEPKPPRPEARFLVLDAGARARVDGIIQRLDANHPLELGVLLAEAGLVSEAREAFTRAMQIPDTADAARRLRDSLDAPPR